MTATTTCARNLPQHFNGCTCATGHGTATAEVDLDLGLPSEAELDAEHEAALDAAWAAEHEAWLAERVAEEEATAYLRSVLEPDKDKIPPRAEPRHPVNECTGADLPRIAFLGKSAYDPDLVTPIRNVKGFPKPNGGTWLSPLNDDGTTVWTEHCTKVIRYDAAVRGRRVHPIGLHPEARVLKIDTMEDLRGAVDAYGGQRRDEGEWGNQVYPDYEEIARHYDAIWLTNRGMNATNKPAPVRRGQDQENLNTWEIESVLILNPDSVHST
jgi:hypothetical protein